MVVTLDKHEIGEAWARAHERGNLRELESLLDESFVYDHASLPEPLDREGYLRLVSALKGAFPDWTLDVEGLAWEGEDRLRWQAQPKGTHENDLDLSGLGWPFLFATGERVELPEETGRAEIEGDRILRLEVDAPEDGGLRALLDQLAEAAVQVHGPFEEP